MTAAAARPLVLGILNITPDSFSDGGELEAGSPSARTALAVARAERLHAEGAAVIDVGGESTRPGAPRVPQAEEAARVLPVVEQLVARDIPVSVDTMNADTARAAVAAGARWINDVSGGQADPGMLPLLAASGVGVILSHWRGHSADMNELADYADPAAEILAELAATRDAALRAGIDRSRLVLDPGLGFAKRGGDNWAVLSSLARFRGLGHPLLIGHSRKRFLGELLEPDASPRERDLPTAVVSALAAREGVWGLRVHDVPATRIALDAVEAWTGGRRSASATAAPSTPSAAVPAAPADGLPSRELDRIRIHRLHVRAFHGVHDRERQQGQDFFIDAEVWLDARAAAGSDDIIDTLHYGHLMRALAGVATGEPVDLLETLAERLAAATFAFEGPRAVRITVHKPQAPVKLRFDDVTVSILRFRDGAGI